MGLALASPAANGATPASIFSTYKKSIAFIETEGFLYNGEIEQISGTGFVISRDGLLITNNHVTFDNKENYKQIIVKVRLGSRYAAPRVATTVGIDRDNDLALLRVTGLEVEQPVPFGKSVAIQPGSNVVVLGFPLDHDLMIVKGLYSGADSKNRWLTDSALNPGNSGGPVFDDAGVAFGVVSGGSVWADVSGFGRIAVEGIKYFIPSDIFHSGIGSGVAGLSTVPSSIDPPASATVFSQSFPISSLTGLSPIAIEANTREFKTEIRPALGYKFSKLGIVPADVNSRTDPRFSIESAGDRAIVKFKLNGEPLPDQLRNLLAASVISEQIKK